MPKPVVIESGGLAENKYCAGNRRWLVSNLIERSKGLEQFDIPLRALNAGSRVWNPIESAYSLALHMKRVQDVDLSHPIILSAEGCIMDGWHRVVKALLEGRETIKAVRFDDDPPCDYEVGE